MFLNSTPTILLALVAVVGIAAVSNPQTAIADEKPTSITAAAIVDSKLEAKWDIPLLSTAPRTFPAPGLEKEGVEALFYQGLPYKGKPTRVFAYIGMPERKGNEKVPGIVLVHGGGGTAFAHWVRLWNSRGYAAIALDTNGATPKEGGGFAMHEYGNLPNRNEFQHINDPIEDQWTYHSVANIMLANSLLSSRPEVDADRIGLTGVSWGGYLTCVTSGVDQRFKFAAPVYGSGFLGDGSGWVDSFKKHGADGTKWLGLWDPARYLKNARMPFLWVYGTNDDAYSFDGVQMSYQLLGANQSTLSTRVRMPHGHGPVSENPEEIHIFANHHLKGGPALTHIDGQERNGDAVTMRYTSARPVVRAELNYTKDGSSWLGRHWDTVAAEVEPQQKLVKATLPAGTTFYFVNLIDDQGLVVSSRHVDVAATNK